jgi:ribosomal protein L11 methyltransferase
LLPKKYHKIVLSCSIELQDILANFLTERGASGVSFEDTPKSGELLLTAYFESESPTPPTKDDIDHYYTNIRENFPGAVYRFVSAEWLQSEDWMEVWKKNFKPLKVSEHFVIRPSWEEYKSAPDEIVINIDPKMAFGTGHHETTAQCLKALEEIDCSDRRLLDYGCGTGILAIAAAKLGASIVTACDNDPEAIEATKENAKLNDVVIFVELAERFVMSPPAEIILANLITDQLIDLYDCLDKSLERNGVIVFSGISVEDYPRFNDFLKTRALIIDKVYKGAEWVTLICRKSEK